MLNQFGTCVPIDPINPVITRSLKALYVPYDFEEKGYLSIIKDLAIKKEIPLIVSGRSCEIVEPLTFEQDKRVFNGVMFPVNLYEFYHKKFVSKNNIVFLPQPRAKSKRGFSAKSLAKKHLPNQYLAVAYLKGSQEQIKCLMHFTSKITLMTWDPSQSSNKPQSYLGRMGYSMGDLLFVNILNYVL